MEIVSRERTLLLAGLLLPRSRLLRNGEIVNSTFELSDGLEDRHLVDDEGFGEMGVL